MTDLLIGTDDGLLLFREKAGDTWQQVAHFLNGYEVNCVAVEDTGRVLVAARDHGLSRIDLVTGAIEALGASVLPKRVRAITISPHDPRRLYAGSEPAMIHVSSDGGREWVELTDVARLRDARRWRFPVPVIDNHIRHILIDRDNPNLIYAAVQIGGIIRSEDGGETWIDVADGLDPDVHTLLQHPGDANILLAVCGGGGYPGAPGEPWAPPPLPQGRPIYRSHDRGKSWECISRDFARTYAITITCMPGRSPVFYSGVASAVPPIWAKRPEKADAALIKSEDGGDTWTEIHEGLPEHFPDMIEAIAIDAKSGNRIFLGTGGEGMKMLPKEQRKGQVLYSVPGKTVWREMPLKLPSIFTLTLV